MFTSKDINLIIKPLNHSEQRERAFKVFKVMATFVAGQKSELAWRGHPEIFDSGPVGPFLPSAIVARRNLKVIQVVCFRIFDPGFTGVYLIVKNICTAQTLQQVVEDGPN